MVTVTKDVEVEIDVDLSDFEDEDIRQEFIDRFLEDMDDERLRKIHDLFRIDEAKAVEETKKFLRDYFGSAL